MLGRVLFSRKKPSQSNNPSSSSSNPLVGRHITNFKSVYTVKKKLDKDGFSIVKDRKGEKLLCKTFDRNKTPEDIRREVEIMYHLDGHPYIARLVDVVNDGISVYIIMKRCRGDLAKIIAKRRSFLDLSSKKKPKPLKEDEVKVVFRQIAEVIHYCHEMNVMHRGIKAESFMLLNKKKGDIMPEDFRIYSTKDNMTVKLIDFSLCTFFNPGELFEEQVGSFPYTAPEVATNSHSYGPKADVWSAGMLLYYLLSGELPFSAETIRESGYQNFNTNPAWQKMPCGARNLVCNMLEQNVEERFSAAQIIGHPWLQQENADPWYAEETDISIIGRMKKFRAMSNFKKVAIMVIVQSQSIPQVQTSGLRNMYELMKDLVRNPRQNNNKDKAIAVEGLTFDEMKGGLAEWGIDDPEIDQLLVAMDVDENKVINQAEFIAATIHGERYGQEDFLKEAFKIYDPENKGYMSVESVQPVLQQLNLPEHKIENIIKDVFTARGYVQDFNYFYSRMRSYR